MAGGQAPKLPFKITIHIACIVYEKQKFIIHKIVRYKNWLDKVQSSLSNIGHLDKNILCVNVVLIQPYN